MYLRAGRTELLIGVFLLVFVAAGYIAMGRWRPRLRERRAFDRYWSIGGLSDGDQLPDELSGARLATLREYFLDYPDAVSPQLHLQAADAMANMENADYLFVEDQVEQVIDALLSGFGPGQSPAAKDFNRLGFADAGIDHWELRWTPAFLTTDVDGDGSRDIVFACPGYAPRLCYLYRHTARSWVKHRLIVGAPVLGIWAYNVTPHGPGAIQIASLGGGDDYDPTLNLDVFAWQHGRLNSVLAAAIPHGFQFDTSQIGRTMAPVIRLFDRDPPGWQGKPRLFICYRWNGERFVAQAIPKPEANAMSQQNKQGSSETGLRYDPHEDVRTELSRAEAWLFEQRDYRGALRALQSLEGAVHASSLAADIKTDLLLELYYHEAICYLKLGEKQQAAIVYTALWHTYPATPWGQSAKAWLQLSGY